MSDYYAEREANLERNKLLLESLGLEQPFFGPKEKPAKKRTAAPKKRKAPADAKVEPSKAQRTDSSDVTLSGTRRSARNAGKKVDYKAERVEDPFGVPASIKSGVRHVVNEGPLGRESGMRLHDPKQFGSIPGIPVGTWWETRQGCSADAIHAPWVAGIAPSKQGAYSVALSGGYDDDVDLGYAFTYTGSGGRDLKGTKDAPKNLRTAPQSCDQTFENNFNRALQASVQTRKPVRVIRGFKLNSPYAPSEGYRYDGLYRVEKAWMEKGLNPEGYTVCKFAFKRLDGQPPLPVRDEGSSDDQASAAANLPGSRGEASLRDQSSVAAEEAIETRGTIPPESDEDESDEAEGDEKSEAELKPDQSDA